MTTTVLTVPAGYTGIVQTEYGNFTIVDNMVEVDSRVVSPLLDAGFSSTDLPDLSSVSGTIELEAPSGVKGVIQSEYGNYPIVNGLVTVDRRLARALVLAGFSNPPLTSGDFTNIASANAADGVYTLNGVTATLEEVIDLTAPDNFFNPATDIDAGGIKTGGSTKNLAINEPLLSSLISNGFTVLVEFYFTDLVTLSALSHNDAYDLQATGQVQLTDLGIPMNNYTSVSDKDFNEVHDANQVPVQSSINKCAFTFSDDRMSASLNGAPIVTIPTPAIDPSFTAVVFGISGGVDVRLRSFAFYDKLADVDLPTLSQL